MNTTNTMLDLSNHVNEIHNQASQYRRDQLAEYHTLVDSFSKLHPKHQDLESRVTDAIHLLLDRLNPELKRLDLDHNLVHDKDDEQEAIRESLGGVLSEETFPKMVKDEHIDAAMGERVLLTFSQMVCDLKQASAARVAWDNKLNEEYVQWSTDIRHCQEGAVGGLVKYYISTQSDYYKRVEHTYKATEEDRNATDWYII